MTPYKPILTPFYISYFLKLGPKKGVKWHIKGAKRGKKSDKKATKNGQKTVKKHEKNTKINRYFSRKKWYFPGITLNSGGQNTRVETGGSKIDPKSAKMAILGVVQNDTFCTSPKMTCF